MELYLLRHGIAEDAAAGRSDASRALTSEGKEKTEQVLTMAEASGVKPSLILSSPYVRAVETARIAASVFGYAGEVTEIKSLVPHGTPVGVWQDLRDYEDEESILLAGHEPLLGQLTGYLLNSPALRVAMKKSCLVRIDLEGFGAVPRGTLRWMLIPRLAREKKS
jgi:phosphohistidine phosphatase